jgi:toxin ParE1/3/4
VTDYKITKSAAADLKEIWNYTADNHSEAQANRYLATLKAGCKKITKNPTMWKLLRLGNSEIRTYGCQQHYIVYLTDDAEVTIIAFLHKRMDFVERLQARLT